MKRFALPRWLMLIGLLVVAALGLIYFQSHDVPTLDSAKQTITKTFTKANPKTVAIVYSGHAFTPAQAQISLGQTIQFENQSDHPILIVSNPPSTHADLPALNSQQQIAPGQSWSFTFPRVGTFGYNNQLAPNEQGSVTIVDAQ